MTLFSQQQRLGLPRVDCLIFHAVRKRVSDRLSSYLAVGVKGVSGLYSCIDWGMKRLVREGVAKQR
jgi:hypothetical protein